MDWLDGPGEGGAEVEFLAMDSGGQSKGKNTAMALEKPEGDEADDGDEDSDMDDEDAEEELDSSDEDDDEEDEEVEDEDEEEEVAPPPRIVTRSTRKRKVLDPEEAAVNLQVR